MPNQIFYMNTNEYKVSVRQVSGTLQISDLTITAKTRNQLKKRLKQCLEDMIEVLTPFNKEIEAEEEKKTRKKEEEKNATKKNKNKE